MNETVAAIRDLLTPADKPFNRKKSYVLGQLAAELIKTASEAELNEVVLMIKDLQESADQKGTRSFRGLCLSMVLGLLQGVLADRHSVKQGGLPPTVSERVLNLLTLEPQNTLALADAIDCSPVTTSLALTQLQDAGLIELKSDSEDADDLHQTYELTARGEQRLDDRFLGQLSDEYQSPQFDFSQALQPLTRVVADLNAHAPVIAELLYPGLDVLKDHVYDQGLRSAAMGELGESYKNMPTAGSSEPPVV